MKLSYILINLVVVIGALVVYDLIRGGGQRAIDGASPPTALEAVTVGEAPPVNLKGTAEEIRAARNANRIAAIERLLATQAAEGGRARRGAAGGSSSDMPLPTIPALDPSDVVDARSPVFHEDTLRTVQAYLSEINRRKVETRTRNRYIGTLGQLKLEATESQREAVIEESLKFGERARAVNARTWSEGSRGRDERRAAIRDLQGEYVSVIQGLLPAADALKILNSRIPRSLGFRTGVRASDPDREER